VPEAGPVRNTLLQLASQVASAVFTAGLTLYLVRALGATGYGVYALAVSMGGLILHPAGLGLPWSIGRFLADHRADPREVRAILGAGLRLQIPAAIVAATALFIAAGAVADAFGDPRLDWPLRWVALSVIGQALFTFLVSVSASVRRVSLSLWMAAIESATETAAAVALVVAGTAAAGAALGKAIGYGVATGIGLYLTLRLLGRASRGGGGIAAAGERKVTMRMIKRYAGAMFVVDVTWSAIAQIDVLLIGAVLSTAAVGSFGAVLRLLVVLGYIPTAVAAGVAPRLSLAAGAPDTRSFEQALRYLILIQGLVIAPMLVWAEPIVNTLLGPGYRDSADIMRVLTLYYFVGAPAALISLAVTYLGEARRRVTIMLGTLAIGLPLTYVLLRAIGVIGAAIADDLIQIAYVSGHVWICHRLIPLDGRRLARTVLSTVAAGAATALALLAVGTGHLSPTQWVAGALAGLAVYIAVLLLTRELSLAEIRTTSAALWSGVRR
jgi:O-antigen/teichoic acid export membrane protein